MNYKGKEYHNLKIVPLTIEQYNNIFFKIMIQKDFKKNLFLKELFDKILQNKNNEPTKWQKHINNVIEDMPELINSEPYDKGWIVKIKVSDTSEVQDLLTSSQYINLTK